VADLDAHSRWGGLSDRPTGYIRHQSERARAFSGESEHGLSWSSREWFPHVVERVGTVAGNCGWFGEKRVGPLMPVMEAAAASGKALRASPYVLM
jgi:hypothetical protein